MKLRLALLFVATASLSAYGDTLNQRTQSGSEATLVFDTSPINQDVHSATLCTKPALAIKKARLWMPDMGHGSGETRILTSEGNCAVITDLDFFMSGTWELDITYVNNDSVAFTFNVVE